MQFPSIQCVAEYLFDIRYIQETTSEMLAFKHKMLAGHAIVFCRMFFIIKYIPYLELFTN